MGIVDSTVVRDSHFDEQGFVNLWVVALATYGVGDIVTTVTIVHFLDGMSELNGVVRFAVGEFGLAGFVALKLLVFGVCLGICLHGARSNDPFLYYLPSGALSAIGGFVTAFNLVLFTAWL